VDEYIDYIVETLNVDAEMDVISNFYTLPLYLRNGYEFASLQTYNTKFLLAKPKEQYNLTILRKQVLQISKITGLDCVLCLESIRAYTKEKMLEERIPFIILRQQIFMPFLGVVLSKNSLKVLPQIDKISITTHKLLLNALYHAWRRTSLTEVAAALGVSKMTITRSFDELESLDLNLIKAEGKLRRFVWDGPRKELWAAVQTHLRNPVAKVYRYDEYLKFPEAKLGGISALSHYTMLDDNAYPTYAISKNEEKILSLNLVSPIPLEETAAVVIQVLRYSFEYQDGIAVDPLTAILSLTDDEKKDPRVELAIESVLEECLHD